MSYSAKNYTEQGGEITHIGGKLVIDSGGTVEGITPGESSYTLPIASADTLGGVKAKAKTAETVEVTVDESGKLFVPAYPQTPSVPTFRTEDVTGTTDGSGDLAVHSVVPQSDWILSVWVEYTGDSDDGNIAAGIPLKDLTNRKWYIRVGHTKDNTPVASQEVTAHMLVAALPG